MRSRRYYAERKSDSPNRVIGLRPFPDHPFIVCDDDAMQQTVESIRDYGVLIPGIVRPLEDGTYEIIAGHRRKYACELAGLKTMLVIVRA